MAVTRATRSGIVAQSYPKRYTSFLAGNASFNPDAHVLIASQTVGSGGAASVTFSSIPQTYRALQIRGIGRSFVGGVDSNVSANFNGDTGANYAFHKLLGDGAAASSAAVTATTAMQWMDITGNGAPANVFGVGVVDILDYSSTSKYKTVRLISGQDQNVHGYASIKSGLWMNSSAITSITVQTQDGASYPLLQYSRFDLYGIV